MLGLTHMCMYVCACALQCRLNTDTLRILCGKSFDLQHCTVKCLQQKFLLGQNGTVELGSAGQEAAVVQQVYAPSSTCEWVVTPVEVVAVRVCVCTWRVLVGQQ